LRRLERILSASSRILVPGGSASIWRTCIAEKCPMKHQDRRLGDGAAMIAQNADAAHVPPGPPDGSTERAQAEALIASELRYRRLFETARDGILILDADTGAVVDVNPFLVELLGFSRETFLGKTLWDLGFFGDIIANRDSFAELKREKYVRYDDKPLKASDGRQIDVEFVSNVYGVNGRAVIQCNVRDITERKRAEAERARIEVHLQQAQKMESVGRLAGGVAHDFNNMLGVILGHADLALEELGAAHPSYDDLMEIRKAANRSADLTRQLLAFARKQTIAPTVLDLNDIVAPMLTMLRRLIGENVELTWRPGQNAWRVRMDPSQIDQVLVNLCVNARDAITGVGRVTIETENVTLDDAYCAGHSGSVPGEYLRLSVSDDGCGMDPVTQAHLFEPFFTTKAVGKGTGLGLATVYGIVKQNHGFIDVCSEPGVGTTVTIYQPRHPDAGGPARTMCAADPVRLGDETILVVEDDPAVRKMTVRMLAGQGYTVLAARSPVEAIRVAGESGAEIHLVMTDVVMPGMNGRELATTLLTGYPHLKRLFTSGYTADVIADHGVLEEGVHFLQKPFSVRELAVKVRQVLDGN
jgi:PAS domain S-box-containing protein